MCEYLFFNKYININMIGQMTNSIINKFINELQQKETRKKIKLKIIEPIMRDALSKYYPYFIFIILLLSLIMILQIIQIYINMKPYIYV